MFRPLLLASLLLVLACGGPRGRRITPGELAALPPESASAVTPAFQPAETSAAVEDLARRRQDLEFDLADWRARSDALAHDSQRAARLEARAVERAEQDLEMARHELSLHEELEVPLRVREADLSLETADVTRAEAQEELVALELLWADAGAEEAGLAQAVLTRARATLRRAELALELATLRRRDLIERLLPRERRERQRAAEDAVERLELARAQAERGPAERARRRQGLEAERTTMDALARSLELDEQGLARDGGWLRRDGA